MRTDAGGRYGGGELAAMAAAPNYYRWVLRVGAPEVGRVTLDHGAGVGNFSTILLEAGAEKVIAVEPAQNLLPLLRSRTSAAGPRLIIVGSTLEEGVGHLAEQSIDTVFSVNVLEHIEDDVRTLQAMFHIVREGGRVVIFVPALPSLYGTLDQAFGHVRRYHRQELQDKVTAAGFRVVRWRFMNLPGIVPWWIGGRLLRARTLAPTSVAVYDRWVVPLLAALEGVCPPPVGQSLLLVGEKPRPRGGLEDRQRTWAT